MQQILLLLPERLTVMGTEKTWWLSYNIQATLKRKGKLFIKFNSKSNSLANQCQHRYALRFRNGEIDPLVDILEVARLVTKVYLTPEQAVPFNPETGILRQLERARNLLSKDAKSEFLQKVFKEAVETYNAEVRKLVKSGALAKNLDSMHQLDFDMVKHVMTQVYDRTVAPDVESLRDYKAGSDNVYGELLTPFVFRILTDANLKSDQVFVDLGSGVGNVVLQAALQFGCESWGCEMTENSCDLAEKQQKEFAARCRLWGIQSGEVHLERGDFRANQAILNTLQRADVILVNNEVFSTELNRNLIDLFLDLKDGCQIISLKSFVDPGHQITKRNIADPANLLRVKTDHYYRNDVSWTDAGGTYFIATKDSSRVKEFIERNR
jgi:H3 lysine-79-specific histone-lysine N-methyltransferase